MKTKTQFWLWILFLLALRVFTASKCFLFAAVTTAATFLFFFLSIPQLLEAAPLRHIIMESDSADSAETQRSCYGIFATLRRGLCLPTNYLIEDAQVKFSILLKAEEESFKISQKIIDRNVDEEFFEQLFKKHNFQASSGAVKVHAIYKMTSFTYTPVSFAVGFKLINPSLPEIHVAGFSQKVLRVTQNFYHKKLFGVADLLVSPSIFYYDRNLFYSDFDIISMVGVKPKDLVEKNSFKGLDSDLSAYWYWRKEWLPSVGMRIENVANNYKCPSCEERFFDIEGAFLTKIRLMISNYINHPIGKSIFATGIPFNGQTGKRDPLETALSYTYQLSSLSAFASFSPLVSSFGFLFSSNSYRVGLQYTDEKQNNSIEIDRQRRTYVYTSFFL